jgi:serine/threonine-protein kinase
MGEVLRVHDRLLDRDVAMKVVRADLSPRSGVLARFLAEARICAGLQHPGIVPIYDRGVLADGRPYFTMKEVIGQTLQEALGRSVGSGEDPVELRRLVEVLLRVCEAVAYAHDRGVIHRDLKPANIMIGEFGEVLVMDWGISRVVGPAGRRLGSPRAETGAPPAAVERLESSLPVTTDLPTTDLPTTDLPTTDLPAAFAPASAAAPSPEGSTRMGDVVGSPGYMSPEQRRGAIDLIGPPSDVFALGCILAEVLRGRIGADDSRWPAELAELVEAAMIEAPSERLPHAGLLVTGLTAWLAGARRREQAKVLVCQAEGERARAESLRAAACGLRSEAAAIWEGRPEAGGPERRRAWTLEDRAAALEDEARTAEAAWREALYAALERDPEHSEAHAALAAHYRARHEEAEARGDRSAVAEALARLRRHDDGTHARWIDGGGALTLLTDPPGAEVWLEVYEEVDRRLVTRPLRRLGHTPLISVPLPMGSYHLLLRAPGRIPVGYPVRIGRTEHMDGRPPGGREPAPIWLPPAEGWDPRDRYVPAGWSLAGSADPVVKAAQPLQRVWVDAMVFRRFPVTNLDYIEWLNALVSAGEGDRAQRHAPRYVTNDQTEASIIYGRTPSGRYFLQPDSDGDLWQPDWPVVMVDWFDAMAFAAGQVGRWRLPHELEWERAARGADGRAYPWGRTLDPSFCAMRASHRGRPTLVSVTDFPTDEGPFGLRGMAGNTSDWCLDPFRPEGPAVGGDGRAERRVAGPDDRRTQRGGTWIYSASDCQLANRWEQPANRRRDSLGIRLCRDAR